MPEPATSTLLLSTISGPEDLKKIKLDQLQALSDEIRALIIKTVTNNGGHLASNLGTVELTLAIHYTYNSPIDKLIWDVGHQAYTHKILTNRRDQFSTLRQCKGLSGYLKIDESEHDIFGAGHAGTAVSAAFGIAAGRDLKKEKYQVVAIIGDGSLTNGITYEGINNIGCTSTDITIVLNDNKWSISKNVGGIVNYLEKLSSTIADNQTDTDFEQIFNSLGFHYYGPVDGHDIRQLISVFELAKKTSGPKLIHVITKKGTGYLDSENSPDTFHSINPFALESGKVAKDVKNLTYTEAFGDALIKIARQDPKILAITAAMPAGTGIDKFAKEFPHRFFDTAIAEEHAVIFAAGLALQGFKPIVAIYSTFLQRSYDQILHDVALQKIPVIFAIDRAGLVGSDGPTHHGTFDLSYLHTIPNLIVMAPKDENELQDMLYTATLYSKGPVAIRYPRGTGQGKISGKQFQRIPIGKSELLHQGQDATILAIGSMVYPGLEAATLLEKENIHINVFNSRFTKPLDKDMVTKAAETNHVLTVEENILEGGFGSAVLEEFQSQNKFCDIQRIGLNGFSEHGERAELLKEHGLTSTNIANQVRSMLNHKINNNNYTNTTKGQQ